MSLSRVMRSEHENAVCPAVSVMGGVDGFARLVPLWPGRQEAPPLRNSRRESTKVWIAGAVPTFRR
jgi:hypothetical protein